MHDLIIRNGRVIDPAGKRDALADVLIRDGRIAAIGAGLPASGAQAIDATGLVVCPGLVDIHVHLREPGFEGAETIASGTRAAAAGGFTTIVSMANTDPVIDTAADVKFVLDRAHRDAIVSVYPLAAVTKSQQGQEIVEFGDLTRAGAVGFSDDGRPIQNNEIMRRAMEYCAMFGAPILDHCGDENLAAEGIMFEGAVAAKLGLKGIPSVAESIQVARDIELAEFTGGRVHILHVSCRSSVELIKRGKERGVAVTAEVTPHHLTLTDEALLDYDANAKMNPPLSSEEERQALRRALADGILDCIATDHAPHSAMNKDKPLAEAPFGIIGLETAFSLVYTEMVVSGLLTLPQLLEKMTVNPARVLNLRKGTLSVGADGDVTLLDPEWTGKIEASMLHSKSRNTPFLGRPVRGRVVATVVGGRTVFRDGVVLA